jgi:hypothetical protein
MTNVNLLREVVEQIEADPESWDQSAWISTNSCKTTFCIAGWACVLANAVTPQGKLTPYGINLFVASHFNWRSHVETVPWPILAQDLLQISDDDADLLFGPDSFDSVETLREDIKRLIHVDLGPRRRPAS